MNRHLVLMSLTFMFLFMGAGAAQPYLTPYFQSCGVSAKTASIMFASVYFSFAATRFWAGYAAGYTGLILGIRLGAFTYALYIAMVSLFPHPAATAAAALIWGMGAAVMWTSSSAYLLNTAPGGRYGYAAGVQAFFLQGGIIIGILVLARLIRPDTGFRTGLAFCTCACGIGALLAFTLVTSGASPARVTIMDGWRILSDRRYLPFAFYLLATGTGYGIILNTFNRFGRAQFGDEAFRFTIILFYVAGALGPLVAGVLSDRGRRGWYVAGGFAAGIAACLIILVSKQAPVLAVASFLLGLMFQVVPSMVTARIGDLTPQPLRPAAVAVIFLWRDIGVASAILAGALFTPDAKGLDLAMKSYLPLFVLGGLTAAILTWREIQREK